MAIEKPMKRRERAACRMKEHREKEKRARKMVLAARDGRYAKKESLIGHVFSVQAAL